MGGLKKHASTLKKHTDIYCRAFSYCPRTVLFQGLGNHQCETLISTAGFAGKQKVYTMYVTFISKQTKHKPKVRGVGVYVNYVSYVDDAWAALTLTALANKQKPETPC